MLRWDFSAGTWFLAATHTYQAWLDSSNQFIFSASDCRTWRCEYDSKSACDIWKMTSPEAN